MKLGLGRAAVYSTPMTQTYLQHLNTCSTSLSLTSNRIFYLLAQASFTSSWLYFWSCHSCSHIYKILVSSSWWCRFGQVSAVFSRSWLH